MLIQKLTAKTVPLRIQKLTVKKCVVDSEIGSRTVLLSIQKSTMKNYVAANSEIGSQKLCCFYTRQVD
jgi:hypothetical protein